MPEIFYSDRLPAWLARHRGEYYLAIPTHCSTAYKSPSKGADRKGEFLDRDPGNLPFFVIKLLGQISSGAQAEN